MHIMEQNIDRRTRRGTVKVQGETFSCRFETDWYGEHRGAYPKDCAFLGRAMPCLKFGFASPWNWTLDLDAAESGAGVVVSSQGYRELKGTRIPFLRTQRFFWKNPEMLYEVSQARHLKDMEYVVYGVAPEAMEVDGKLERIIYRRDDVRVCWQFSPSPVYGQFRAAAGGWVFEFESPEVECLLQWNGDGAEFPRFRSGSSRLQTLRVNGTKGERSSPQKTNTSVSSRARRCFCPMAKY